MIFEVVRIGNWNEDWDDRNNWFLAGAGHGYSESGDE